MTQFRRRLVRLARAHRKLTPVQVLNLTLGQHRLPKVSPAGAKGKPGIRVIRLARARPKLRPAAILALAGGAKRARAHRAQVAVRIARMARAHPHLKPMQVVRIAARR
jgi:hypothetical protein